MLDLNLGFVPIKLESNIKLLVDISKEIGSPLYMKLDKNYIWNTFEEIHAPLLFCTNNYHIYDIRKKRYIYRHSFSNFKRFFNSKFK